MGSVETQTQTLTEFLLARIEEDADAAQDCGVNEWVPTFREGIPTVELSPDAPYQRVVAVEPSPRQSHAVGVVRGYQAHIARHDPARVLAECEAKRRIVEEHPEPSAGLTVMDHWCWESGDPSPGCPTMRALASVYADHPDYRQEWKT